MKKWFAVCLALGIGTSMLASCGGGKEKIVIYTSAEDYRIEYLQSRLDEEFPQYKIILEKTNRLIKSRLVLRKVSYKL